MYGIVSQGVRRLHLDFNFHTAGQFQLHQGIYGLGIAAVDIDKALVGRDFELFAALLVDEGTAVYGNDTLARGEGNRSADDGSGSLDALHNLVGRFLDESVVVRLQFDSDFLTHDVFVIFPLGASRAKSHSLARSPHGIDCLGFSII